MKNFIKDDVVANKCHWHGCGMDGEYPAPISPDNLNQKNFYCLEHIRIYNKNWNFFAGKDDLQYEQFVDDSITGHRPTWKMGVRGGAARSSFESENIRKAFYEMFDDDSDFEPEANIRISEKEQNALAVLQLSLPLKLSQVKLRYKELVKKHHPDRHGKESEDVLKKIIEAYNQLKNSSFVINDL